MRRRDHLADPTDVTVEAEVEGLFNARSTEGFGRWTWWSTAPRPRPPPIEQMRLAEWRGVLDANLTSVFLCAPRGAEADEAPGPRAGSSRSALWRPRADQRPDAAAYVAAKAGLDGLTRALALDGRDHGVAVSVLHPGFTVTGFGPDADGKVGRMPWTRTTSPASSC